MTTKYLLMLFFNETKITLKLNGIFCCQAINDSVKDGRVDKLTDSCFNAVLFSDVHASAESHTGT